MLLVCWRAAYDLDHMSIELPALNVPIERLRLRSKERLFSAGQRVQRVFFLKSGAVTLVRAPSRQGAETVIHTARAGEWIAESSLFSDKYHCDARARSECELLVAKRADVLEQLSADPGLCFEFAEMLAAQLRKLRTMQEILRTRGAEERFVRWLFANATGSPASVELSGTLTDLADTLALSREALYRVVGKLRRSRLISTGKNRIVLSGRLVR